MALLVGTVGEISENRKNGGRELSIEWQINDFSVLSDEVGDCYDSPLFRFSDGCCSLRLFPNGDASAPGCMGLSLSRKDSDSSTFVYFTFSVRGLEQKAVGEGVLALYEEELGWFDICPRQKLGNKDDVLTVTCDLTMDEPSSSRGVEELQQSLQKLLESGKDSDVIIKVQGIEFSAHRLLLRARSPVFEAMFSHDMVEKKSGVVTMEDCNPDTFPDFLKYVYTGKVDMISTKNVFDLYTAADKYDLNTLKVESGEFKKNLTIACFCHAVTLAVKHGERTIIECATEFFYKNAFNIVKTAEWQIFLAENPIVGNELFIKLLSKHKHIFCVNN